jgi:peptidoglycan/LPS O-acetylase OafA/YrhL
MEPIRPIYHSLNGLRGLAAIIVVLFHAEAFFGRQVAPGGYLAVDLFFVLSGFVIAHAYDHKFAAGLGAWSFIRHRLIRFYPLYLLGLIIGASWMALELILSPPAALTGQQLAIAFSLGLLFLPSPFGWHANLYPLNVPAWSLFFELAVNAAYALCYRLLTTRVLIGFTLLASALLAAQTLLWGFGTPFGSLARSFFSFPLGVLIYRFRERIPVVPVPPALLVTLLCVPMLIPVSDALRQAYDLACILFLFPAGIALASRIDSPRLMLPMERLGLISFPLYAIHHPVLQVGLGIKDYIPVPPAAIGLGLILGLLVACSFIDLHYDGPARRWLVRTLVRHKLDPARRASERG